MSKRCNKKPAVQSLTRVISDPRERHPQTFEAHVLPLVVKLRKRASFMTHDPEDLVQETLLRAWRAWGSQQVENVWAWLFLILRNVQYDRYRVAGRWRDTVEAHASEIGAIRAAPPPPPDAALGILDDATVSAIRELPEGQRAVIEAQLAGEDDRVTAERLRTNLNSVRVASWKARARLRETL